MTASDRNTILAETVKRLIRRDAKSHLSKIVNRTHAADLSAILQALPRDQQFMLFELVHDLEKKGMVLSELDEDTFVSLVENLNADQLAAIFNEIPNDDVADLLARLPDDLSQTILSKMHKDDSKEVEDLMQYDDDTAGGIMVPEFLALNGNMTAREAIATIQKEENLEIEMPFYVYVVDDEGRLVGVVSLRQLVVTNPQKPLKSFMFKPVYSVTADTDQEEVAKLVARYDILAVPVVDDENKIIGVVTVDDVLDIFREEATEDMLKMAGLGDEYADNKSVFKGLKIRTPWLVASCIGGIIAASIIVIFDGTLALFPFLAAFQPVISGMGGNVGSQSATIVVRGIATGRIETGSMAKIIGRELAIGVTMGFLYGIVVGLIAQFKINVGLVGLVVGMALMCSMSIAAFMGSALPILFSRMKIDPAVATGPFVTTSVDIVSITLYYLIATFVLGWV